MLSPIIKSDGLASGVNGVLLPAPIEIAKAKATDSSFAIKDFLLIF